MGKKANDAWNEISGPNGPDPKYRLVQISFAQLFTARSQTGLPKTGTGGQARGEKRMKCMLASLRYRCHKIA